nr:EOG090X0A4V [Ilyocryptus agilis]
MSVSTNRTWRILEFYSGIGGMHYACELAAVMFKVVFAVDINDSANTVYSYNFPEVPQQARNIGAISAEELNKLKPEVLMMSPPCQPFTRVGLKLDTEDPRCSSFLHLLNVIPHVASLEYLLMENVVGFETSAMREAFVETLEKSGYHFREFILSPEVVGIPNCRNRYYLIARKSCDFAFGSRNEILRSFPNNESLIKSRRGDTLECYLEDLKEEDLDRYLLPDQTLVKHWRVLDIRQRCDKSSCCFTKAYSHYAEGTGSVLQHDQSQSFHQQFANYAASGDVGELKKLKLRYFTPREVASLMGFPPHFDFPSSVALKTKYRLLGNSLNAFVVANLLLLLTTE